MEEPVQDPDWQKKFSYKLGTGLNCQTIISSTLAKPKTASNYILSKIQRQRKI